MRLMAGASGYAYKEWQGSFYPAKIKPEEMLAFYSARLLIGFFVGITTWPRPWYARGPLCGFLLMLPPGLIALASPGCGPRCMSLNELSAMLIGATVGGIARVITGKDHA